MAAGGQGRLVLVVGPSGSGKDTLIGAAKAHFAGDSRFCFPQRVVTRDAVAELEPHESVDFATFERLRAAGECALSWEAHGLGYLLPLRIKDDLDAGRIVVCNVSRRVIETAREKFAGVVVIEVTAPRQVRAARLAGRGRETAEEIEARLAREPAPVPDGPGKLSIDNGGDLESGVSAFTAALAGLAVASG